MKYVFAVVFVVILTVVVIAQYAPQNTAQQLPSLPTFKLEAVKSFTIKVDGKLSLQGKRDGEKWLLLSDSNTVLQKPVVEQLLYDLQHMQVKRVASKNPNQQSRFAVAESEVLLKDGQGEILLDVFVGKPATDLMSTYIRLANHDDVLTVDKILTWQVKRTPDAWVQKEETAEKQ